MTAWRPWLILAALAALALALYAGATARADGPSETVLEPLPSASLGEKQENFILSTRLLDDKGQPISGAPVTYYMLTTVFGERLMKVGDAFTDGTGTASLFYKPTWVGDHTVVARFAGNGQQAATQTTFGFTATGPVPVHENARFGLEEVRRWLPFAVGAAVLAVWGTLGLVMMTTVRGLRAAAASAQPHAMPTPPHLRPAPMGRPLVAILLGLLVLALVPGVWLLPRLDRGGNEVNLSGDYGFGSEGGEPPGQKEPIASQKPLPVTLVRSVEAMVFGDGGQLVPGSADLPADVALVNDRVLVLDTNKGRILAVTADGGMVPVLETDPTREESLRGATAMAARGEQLFVANSTSGSVLIVDASGRVEEVIKPAVPEGLEPLNLSGIAVTDRGEIWISDADNHRVLLLDRRGEFLGGIGQGIASSADDGFNSPAGLALDDLGNLYVVDKLNGVVKEYSPLGVFLASFGDGFLALPRAVAVDAAGRVFVSDEKTATVSVFAPGGAYLGSIGQDELHVPHGLRVRDGLLYVMDRLAGLFVFQLQANASGP